MSSAFREFYPSAAAAVSSKGAAKSEKARCEIEGKAERGAAYKLELTRASGLGFGASGVGFGLLGQLENPGGNPGGKVVAGAMKKGENRIVGRLFKCTIIWAIKLGGYYSEMLE
jgi:hypothetical protein